VEKGLRIAQVDEGNDIHDAKDDEDVTVEVASNTNIEPAVNDASTSVAALDVEISEQSEAATRTELEVGPSITKTNVNTKANDRQQIRTKARAKEILQVKKAAKKAKYKLGTKFTCPPDKHGRIVGFDGDFYQVCYNDASCDSLTDDAIERNRVNSLNKKVLEGIEFEKMSVLKRRKSRKLLVHQQGKKSNVRAVRKRSQATNIVQSN